MASVRVKRVPLSEFRQHLGENIKQVMFSKPPLSVVITSCMGKDMVQLLRVADKPKARKPNGRTRNR
jgi:hypothetical protein